MTELRVTVPDETAERLASEAADRGTSAEDVAAEVLRLHAPLRRGTRRFGFIGIGEARPGFSVRQAEERLEGEGVRLSPVVVDTGPLVAANSDGRSASG